MTTIQRNIQLLQRIGYPHLANVLKQLKQKQLNNLSRRPIKPLSKASFNQAGSKTSTVKNASTITNNARERASVGSQSSTAKNARERASVEKKESTNNLSFNQGSQKSNKSSQTNQNKTLEEITKLVTSITTKLKNAINIIQKTGKSQE